MGTYAEAKGRKPSTAHRGKGWEAALDVQHRRYRTEGVADLEKVPTPIRPLGTPINGGGRTGAFQAVYEPRRHVDFIGVLAGGRCARLEAKQQSNDGRFPIAAVSEHQAESLARCEALGGFAAVLVLHPSGMYLVPWCNWRPVSKCARVLVSLDADALEQVGARFGDDAAAQRVLAGLGSPADWLRAAKERGWL